MRRLLVLLVVALGLAPGTWWRSPRTPDDTRQLLTVRAITAPRVELGPLEAAGAWQLYSPNSSFNSYSALVAFDDGTLLAASDRGGFLRFSPPGEPPAPVRIGMFANSKSRAKRDADIEAMTRDPATGRLWAAFEKSNKIAGFDQALSALGAIRPRAMRNWPENQGPEAMVRLVDGRFIVLAEGSPRWFDDGMPGVLFAADPVAGGAPIPFRFVPPAGYRPVDLAQMPDGKVLILLRKVDWGLPPHFRGKLMLADPAAIRAGTSWRARALADLAEPLPSDNYEGLAALSDGHGGAIVWLISDDNGMAYQRTLLLRLRWPAREKARGSPRAPR